MTGRAANEEVNRRIRRVRRPSGVPPPLPREINKSAVGWLVAFGIWIVVWVRAFFNFDTAVWITERTWR